MNTGFNRLKCHYITENTKGRECPVFKKERYRESPSYKLYNCYTKTHKVNQK